MTQEEKQLLLQDLCARLPYGVKVNLKSRYEDVFEIVELNGYHIFESSYYIEYGNMRPYLRPMSSMTTEERKELSNLINNELNDNQEDDDSLSWVLYASNGIKNQTGGERFYFNEMSIIYDWLNKKKFDYRGIIPMGLALSAPKGMYNSEK